MEQSCKIDSDFSREQFGYFYFPYKGNCFLCDNNDGNGWVFPMMENYLKMKSGQSEQHKR